MSVDDGVGLLLDALTETGQLDNTLIIFTSDNGYMLGEHGRFNDKRLPYEESIPRAVRPSLSCAGHAVNDH